MRGAVLTQGLRAQYISALHPFTLLYAQAALLTSVPCNPQRRPARQRTTATDMISPLGRPSHIAKDVQRTKIIIPHQTIWAGNKMPGSGRELPMPTVNRITSLTQAHATLLHCWIRLAMFSNGSAPNSESPTTPASDDQEHERNRFQQWLEQWESAFSAYLSTAIASMVNEDITESRILKTNHLACTIMASGANTTTSKSFETPTSTPSWNWRALCCGHDINPSRRPTSFPSAASPAPAPIWTYSSPFSLCARTAAKKRPGAELPNCSWDTVSGCIREEHI